MPYVIGRAVVLAELGCSVVVCARSSTTSGTTIISASSTAVVETVDVIVTAAIVETTTSTTGSISGNAPTNRCMLSVCDQMCEMSLLTFRRNACADLNIGLFDDHATLKLTAAGTTMLRSQSPFAIGVGESRDGNDTDAGLVVAAISGTEAYTPSSLS